MAPISAALLIGALVATFLAVFTVLSAVGSARYSRMLADFDSLGKRAEHRVQAIRGSRIAQRLFGGMRTRAYHAKLEQGIPEALRLMGIALDSGSSLSMALEYAANSCSEPLASQLKRAVWDLQAGQGFDEAMEKLRQRTGGSEFAYLAVAMEIQHRAGGGLTYVLESVSHSLQQAAELKEELKTKTAQGRLSMRIVAVMPFALLVVLTAFSPGYVTGFFSSPLGIFLFLLAMLLEGAGIVFVRKSLSVDTSFRAKAVTR